MKLYKDFYASRGARPLQSLMFLSVAALVAGNVQAAGDDRIVEVNITNNLAFKSGEPQVAVVEMAFGSADVPAWTYPFRQAEWMKQETVVDRLYNQSGVYAVSSDRGLTWAHSVGPSHTMVGPHVTRNENPLCCGGDSMIAAGPNLLYIDVQHGAGPSGYDLSHGAHVLMYSADWGKTWSELLFNYDPPIDRPWMKVDRSTGKLYVASSGFFDAATRSKNVAGTGIMDRWLVTYEPRLKGHSEPRRMGGPELELIASANNDLAAAYGTVASIFSFGGMGRGPGAQANAAPPQPRPVPESLKKILPAGVECAQGTPRLCLFFQATRDDVRTWERHYVPTPEGFTGGANMAADQGKRGRFAISMAVGASIVSMVTEDGGKTWSPPAQIPQTAPGRNFKTRVAYAPNGVLAYIWKKERADLNPTPLPARTETAFDVYSAVSCDGGRSWPKAVKVSSLPSPPGVGEADDLTYLDADPLYAHLIFGDRRDTDTVRKAHPDSTGPVGQAYYARVPFSLLSDGKKCGR